MSKLANQPWASDPGDEARVLEPLGILDRQRVISIEYRYPAHFYFFPEPCVGHYDQSDMTVLMRFESGASVLIRGAMQGLMEGLAFEISPEEKQLETELPLVIQPSMTLRNYLVGGVSILTSRVAWQTPSSSPARAIAGLRLDLEQQRALTIVLGQPVSGGTRLEYVPDTLALVYDASFVPSYVDFG